MLKHWWKLLGVILVLYGLIAGMLVPLKPNIIEASNIETKKRTARLGESVTLEVVGYNSSFAGADAGAMKAWLRAKPVNNASQEFSVAASEIEVINDRRAKLTFQVPRFLPDTSAEKATLSIVVQNPVDGYFVDPFGVDVRQSNPATSPAEAQAAWQQSNIKSGDVTATPYITFPFRGHLAETIRNTYFHVSLWFAMIFVFIAGCVYAVKYLRRSGKTSDELPGVVSLRDKADYWSVAFTSVGMLFGTLGLATGAVWAKYTWGSFWSWDPKQVTTLIALLIYAGYFVLRAAFRDPEQRARLSAVYNIFAFILLIPLIYVLPRMANNSLHPGMAGNPALGGEDLDSTMRMVFYPIIIGWTLIGFWMATVSYRIQVARERILEKSYRG